MNEQKQSTFVVTCRLMPETSFFGLEQKVTTDSGFELSFKEDLVWIRFEATPDTWESRRDQGLEYLRTILGMLSLRTGYPFVAEHIQWIEVKPRQALDKGQFVLGKLGDLVAQRKPPEVTEAEFQKGTGYLILSELNPYFRMAMVDYRAALSFPREAIVFCARAVEWVEQYFDLTKLANSPTRTSSSRVVMCKALRLEKRWLTQFFKLANDTTVARHAKNLAKIRPPSFTEIRFAIFYCRQLLDRFALYIWWENQEALQQYMRLPNGFDPQSQFLAGNKRLATDLEAILSNRLA